MPGTLVGEFQWIDSPGSTIGVGLERWGDEALEAVKRVFEAVALKVRSYAVTNAPWTDRTTNARMGLRTMVEVAGAVFTLVLFHTASYGIWLEIRNAGKYAIILRTLEVHYPVLMRMIENVLKG